jgi:catechol 2,3-dioxygenase-like lactoylglutathione lyase family enzyme
MRLDHIAYRTADRKKTAQFFIDAFGYRVQTEFDIKFDDGSTAKCIALEPPEKAGAKQDGWLCKSFVDGIPDPTVFHMAPEIFVSDGDPESIVGRWVAARGGVGGIHHMAYQVESVEKKMAEWKEKGYAEFTSDKPMTCPGLTQVFTKPSALTGVIYEFIERGEHGFCRENVRNLMESTKGL